MDSTGGSGYQNVSNLVNSSGVVASDTTGVGTARTDPEAATYGGDKAVFAYGKNAGYLNVKNLCSNSGVIAADVTGVGTARISAPAASYGSSGQAIFAFGFASDTYLSMSNLGNRIRCNWSWNS